MPEIEVGDYREFKLFSVEDLGIRTVVWYRREDLELYDLNNGGTWRVKYGRGPYHFSRNVVPMKPRVMKSPIKVSAAIREVLNNPESFLKPVG